MITLEQYTERINGLAERLSQGAAMYVIVPTANELLANIKNRIMIDGKDSNGNKIANYSTKPAYYTREQFDRRGSFSAKGKNSRNDFANGNKRKSMYLQGGYKELRSIQGKPVNTMVLNYTGSTMNAYQQKVTENEVLQGMTTELASDIRHGHEERLNKDIYKPSKSELEAYNKNIVEELAELNVKILTGVSG